MARLSKRQLKKEDIPVIKFHIMSQGWKPNGKGHMRTASIGKTFITDKPMTTKDFMGKIEKFLTGELH